MENECEIFEEQCRICLSRMQEDAECLFQFVEDEETPQLSGLGMMYEDLFGLTVQWNPEHPQFLCSSCILQLKLCYKLKLKAIEANKRFTSLLEFEGAKLEVEDSTNFDSKQMEIVIEHIKSEEDKFLTVDDDTECIESEEDEFVYEEDVPDFDDLEVVPKVSIHIEQAHSSDEFEDYEEIDDEQLESEYEKLHEEDYLQLLEPKPTKAKNIRTFSCNLCSETFSKKLLLKNHKMDSHSKKRLTCELCQKKVFSEEALQVHYNLHNGLPAYECEECHKTFNQKTHYKYHMMSHSNQRDVICDICQKGFLCKGDLTVHMRMHTDERRYSCDVCHKAFRAYSHMTNHRFSHFSTKFECQFCQQLYSSPNTLRTHIKSIHTNDNIFQCEYCDKQFKRKHHLQAHMKLHQNVLQNFLVNEFVE